MSNLFKIKSNRNRPCTDCKYYERDAWYDKYPHFGTEGIDNGHRFAKCNHPNARFTYVDIERDTSWLDSKFLKCCSRGGRRFEPAFDRLANILRKK